MPRSVRDLWTSRFARRLTIAFVATAVAAAALTTLLVNLAIGARFDAYLDSQRQAREQQIVDLLAAEYQQAGGWRSESLNRLAPAFVMSGARVELLDAGGRRLWSPDGFAMSPQMQAMHREMMDVAEPGASSRLPVVVGGRRVGTAVLQVPQAALPAADAQFRTSVNRLLFGGALAAGASRCWLGWPSPGAPPPG